MINIKYNRRIQKNIKQNLSFYRSPAKEAEEFAQGILNRIIMVVLGLFVAIFSIFGSFNILFRIPDFFRYEFDRIQVSGLLDINITSTDLGGFFSRFMLHRIDAFSLSAEFEGSERELFNKTEEALMNNFRTLLDVLLIIAIVSLLVSIFLIVVMQYNRMAKNLRKALNIGLAVYLATMVGLVLYFDVYGGSLNFRNSMMEGKFAKEDLLHRMFDGQFTLDTTVAVTVISFIIMMIIRYTVWKLTAQKGIFSEGLKGVAK